MNCLVHDPNASGRGDPLASVNSAIEEEDWLVESRTDGGHNDIAALVSRSDHRFGNQAGFVHDPLIDQSDDLFAWDVYSFDNQLDGRWRGNTLDSMLKTKKNRTYFFVSVVVFEIKRFAGTQGAAQKNLLLLVVDHLANVRVQDVVRQMDGVQGARHFAIGLRLDSEIDGSADECGRLPEIDGRILHSTQQIQLHVVGRRRPDHHVPRHEMIRKKK